MAKYCRHCGAQLRDEAVFCKKCGQSTARSRDKSSAEPDSAASVQPAAAKKTAKKPFPFAAVAVALAVVLVIEGVVAGLWYPGFLRPKNTEPEGVVTVSEDEMEELVKEDADTEAVSDLTVASLPDTKDIKIRYSEDEINSAPAQTAKVSPENPVADFGDVKVDFKSWNLEGEDELTVRTLGEKTDSTENGWSINAYDFSLKSGKHKFATRVAVTISCTAASGELASCVGFNKETGKWEDLRTELSKDGKSCTFYTTHFSPEGLKYKFIVKDHKLQANKEGKTLVLDNGIFKERFQKGVSRMNWAVDMDTEILWNLVNKIDKKTFDKAIYSLFPKSTERRTPWTLLSTWETATMAKPISTITATITRAGWAAAVQLKSRRLKRR